MIAKRASEWAFGHRGQLEAVSACQSGTAGASWVCERKRFGGRWKQQNSDVLEGSLRLRREVFWDLDKQPSLTSNRDAVFVFFFCPTRGGSSAGQFTLSTLFSEKQSQLSYQRTSIYTHLVLESLFGKETWS